MGFLKAAFTAFSMYSILPVPRTRWDEDSMKYAMCFFPLIGVVNGALLFLWASLAATVPLGGFLFAAVACALPVLVTGGIHMDGFCDTTDALSSRQPREKKLEILKDPNAGAFAVIGCVLYFLVLFGLWTELVQSRSALLVLGGGFVLSRIGSGLSVVTLRPAKNSGLLAAFSNAADKRRVRTVLLCELLLCAVFLLWADAAAGGAALLVALLVFVCYYRVSYREFGGITGDLAGWFLQLCEAGILLSVVLAQKLF